MTRRYTRAKRTQATPNIFDDKVQVKLNPITGKPIDNGSNTLADRRQKDVAAMLGHFKALVNLAAAPVASKEAAAAQALEMAVHSSALVYLTLVFMVLWLINCSTGGTR